MAQRNLQLQSILLQLLPADHSAVGNMSWPARYQAATKAAGILGISDDDLKTTRDALVETGQAIKGTRLQLPML